MNFAVPQLGYYDQGVHDPAHAVLLPHWISDSVGLDRAYELARSRTLGNIPDGDFFVQFHMLEPFDAGVERRLLGSGNPFGISASFRLSPQYATMVNNDNVEYDP